MHQRSARQALSAGASVIEPCAAGASDEIGVSVKVYHVHRGQPSSAKVSNSEQYAGGTPASECDVIVVGGGPAGCTAATVLARKGWSVTLLEKDRYPRFHIGESLLPMNLPILQRLGRWTESSQRQGVRSPQSHSASTAYHPT